MSGRVRWDALKLAVFTLVTIAVTTWLATIIGNIRLFAQPYVVRAEFSDATGLLQGDVIKAAGVSIGRVDSIEVSDGIAVVTMSIDEGVDLPGDVGAQIRFRNLIGQRMITLLEDDEEATLVETAAQDSVLLEDGDLIPLERTEAAFDLSELFNGLRPIIRSTSPEDINIVTTELVAALQGRGDETERILANLSEIAKLISSRDQQLTALLEDLNIVTGDLAAKDVQLRDTLASLDDFLADMQASQDDLDAALVNLDDAAGRLKRVIADNDQDIRAELSDLQVILDAVEDKRADLRAVVRSLPEFAVAIERVSSYGEWSTQHLIHACQDDFGDCGMRGTP